MNICKNCVYFDDGFVGDNCIGEEECRRPIFSPVWGQTALGINPKIERTDTSPQACGETGTYFCQKAPQNLRISFFNILFK